MRTDGKEDKKIAGNCNKKNERISGKDSIKKKVDADTMRKKEKAKAIQCVKSMIEAKEK